MRYKQNQYGISGIRFQEFEKMNNLTFWNLIPPRFLLNFSSYEHSRRLTYPILKMTYLLGMLKVQTHFCKYKGVKIQEKQYGASDFKTIRLSNIQTFWNLIPNLICFYLGSRISYRKVFVLQTKLWIPPFQWIVSHVCSQRN